MKILTTSKQIYIASALSAMMCDIEEDNIDTKAFKGCLNLIGKITGANIKEAQKIWRNAKKAEE